LDRCENQIRPLGGSVTRAQICFFVSIVFSFVAWAWPGDVLALKVQPIVAAQLLREAGFKVDVQATDSRQS
jgi:hypothetical protein